MTHLSLAALIAATLLAGCSNPEKTGRYLIDAPRATARLPNVLGRVEVRDVSLPQYAATQEIAVQAEDGAVRSSPDQVWADDPVRAVTQLLATQITELSGAQAIAEPWPFSNGPDRRLEVRIEQMLAAADGRFLLSGRYFVASLNDGGREIDRSFNIVVPIEAEGPAAIAAAQSRALQDLAARIAVLGQ